MRSAGPTPAIVFALGLVACVDDTTVLGDGRPARACAAAEQILAPPAGCTTLTLRSTDPWGCLLFDPSGVQTDTAGTWVRVATSFGRAATVRITLLTPTSTCAVDAGLSDASSLPDGGTSSCPAQVWMTTGNETPCSCGAGAVPYDFDTSLVLPLTSTEQQILLQPFGATFEVSVCDAGP